MDKMEEICRNCEFFMEKVTFLDGEVADLCIVLGKQSRIFLKIGIEEYKIQHRRECLQLVQYQEPYGFHNPLHRIPAFCCYGIEREIVRD